MENTTFRTQFCPGCPMAATCSEHLYDVDGQQVCESNLEALGYTVCADCGALIRMDDAYTTSGGCTICRDCCDESYSYCECCGEYVHNDDSREVDGGHEYVCTDCLDGHPYDYFQCEDCGNWFSYRRSNSVDVRGHGTICEDCYYDGSYARCEGCDDVFPSDNLIYDEENDESYCSDCWDEHHSGDERHKLQRYSYKPTPIPRTRKKCTCDRCSDITDLLFGLELEVDKGPYEERDTAISEIADASEDVYMKHDGSLDTGFEIVTHPCTLEYHQYQFKWRAITSIAKKHGFKSHDARTCGLHVHVGRYQLGEDSQAQRDTIGKILLLVDRHWDPLVKFSRRHNDQLRRWAARPAIDRPRTGCSDDTAISMAWAANNGNRYQAVNLCNSGTVEFRMFNGTLKRDTIIATIQLLSNLCLYAKTHSVTECLESAWSDLVQYTPYDELNEYCKTQGLMGAQAEASAPTDANLPLDINDIQVGMNVRAIDENCLPFGYVGTVRSVDRNNGPIEFWVGVEFTDFIGGHDLNGLTHDNPHGGYWMGAEQLAIA